MNENKHLLNRTGMVIICALFCTALWGSAFPSIKLGYQLFGIEASDTASQIFFAGIRFFGAGIMAWIIGSISQKAPLIPKKASWWKICVLALFQTIIQYLFFYVGLAHTTGVKGSVLQGTNTLFSLLIACFILKTEKMTALKAIGSIIGFIGLIVVNSNGAGLDMQFAFNGEGFLIIAACSSAFSAVCIKIFSRDEFTFTLTSYQFAIGGLVMMLVGIVKGGRLSDFTMKGGVLLLYMMFISAAAYSVWGLLLKYNPVSKITVFSFTNEIFGVVFSCLLLKESQSIGVHTIIALLLVCTGIILVNKRDANKL